MMFILLGLGVLVVYLIFRVKTLNEQINQSDKKLQEILEKLHSED